MINRTKKSIANKLSIALFVLGFSTPVFSQTLDSVVNKFKDHRNSVLTEKIFIHCDQRFYLIGETLWFSVYYVDGTLHKPLNVSKVVYVEILDANNTPVLSAKVALNEGRGNGSFYLPSTIHTGNYTLRAYTQWMRNFDPAFYFHQPLTIVNPFVAPETLPQTPETPPTVAFFPEGGHLVAGLKSKVAFKITDNAGRGMPGQGAVINAKNDTIATFHTGKFGMGNFEFTPTSEKYHAILEGIDHAYPLPQAASQGFVMHVEDKGDGFITVNVAAQLQEMRPTFVSLFIHTRQVISVAEVSRLRNGVTDFIIEKNKLPEGISHLTVFDSHGVPVCERLFFKRPNNELTVKVTPESRQFGKRRNVTLNVETLKRSSGAQADLSIAVYKKDSFAIAPSRNIFSYLQLSSDLIGDIESEDYYFSTDSLVQETVDNLMLTHGWRRFKWDNILAGTNDVKHSAEYRSHIIRASATSPNGEGAEVLAYLSVPGSATALYASRSDRQGSLQYELNRFYGSRKIVLKTSAESLTPTISVANPFSSNYAFRNRRPLNLDPSHSRGLLQRSVAMQAEDIFHEEKHVSKALIDNDTIAFYGTADETYLLDDYTRFPVMEEVMREYVRGVFVRKRKDGFHFIVINSVKDGVLENPMILLDGVPFFDADRIMELDPLKIKKIEVMKRRFFLGPATFNGLVSFTSYNKDVAGIQLDPGVVALDYEGLQRKREFFHPQYSTQKQRSSRVPDRRYLLYWNPQVSTNPDGNLEIEFYTSDVPGEYEIEVQGTTKDGHAGSGRATIKVN